MLYIIYRANRPGLKYRGGQDPILHLRADLHAVIDWAEKQDCDWVFTDVNASTSYAQFFNDRCHLSKINWDAVKATHWSDVRIKDGKQAEFLLHDFFPLDLVEGIGVVSEQLAQQVRALVGDQLRVKAIPRWYY